MENVSIDYDVKLEIPEINNLDSIIYLISNVVYNYLRFNSKNNLSQLLNGFNDFLLKNININSSCLQLQSYLKKLEKNQGDLNYIWAKIREIIEITYALEKVKTHLNYFENIYFDSILDTNENISKEGSIYLKKLQDDISYVKKCFKINNK